MAEQVRAEPVAIVWLRDDLRLDDNPALRAAIDGGYTPLPVYIHAPDEEGAWAPGAASNAWRYRSLSALDAALRDRGSRLRRFFGPSLPTLRSLAAISEAQAVFWNRRYEPEIERRDADIKRALRADGVRAESFNAALLFEPWEVETKQGDPYKVFSPFWKTALAALRVPRLWNAPDRLAPVEGVAEGVALEALKLAPAHGWDAGIRAAWHPGEAGARAALEKFVGGPLAGYRERRDLPADPGTSRLSPHLHFGEVSVQRIVAALQLARAEGAADDADAHLRQLGWREFSYHLLHHFPRVAEHNLNPRFDTFDWGDPDPVALAAWQRGRTGIPIIDAGMRELWHSGWMHNRVRMLVASFLSKNLRQHWLLGARWFWDTLVDADLANNTQGWQWTAGTGADAAPYFRIFNPVTQAHRFDPAGTYVRRWVPELAGLPTAALFAPWEHPALLEALAPHYPRRPIVDLAASRATALLAYQHARH